MLLEDQDRSRWDRAAIAEGQAVLARAIRLGPAGPYQLQAAIALEHDLAPDAGATDWHAIIALFQRLDELAPSPVVALNHAVAVSMIEGPEAALARVADWSTDRRLREYHLYHAVLADLYRRSGDRAAAADAYRAAIDRCLDPAERRLPGAAAGRPGHRPGCWPWLGQIDPGAAERGRTIASPAATRVPRR